MPQSSSKPSALNITMVTRPPSLTLNPPEQKLNINNPHDFLSVQSLAFHRQKISAALSHVAITKLNQYVIRKR